MQCSLAVKEENYSMNGTSVHVYISFSRTLNVFLSSSSTMYFIVQFLLCCNCVFKTLFCSVHVAQISIAVGTMLYLISTENMLS